jgi:hypothetical protein
MTEPLPALLIIVSLEGRPRVGWQVRNQAEPRSGGAKGC